MTAMMNEAPGSSYIWQSGKVTSNLSQIPNNFCLKSSISDKKEFSRDQPPLRAQRKNCHFYATLPGSMRLYMVISVPFAYSLVHSTTRDLNFEGTLSSLGLGKPVVLKLMPTSLSLPCLSELLLVLCLLQMLADQCDREPESWQCMRGGVLGHKHMRILELQLWHHSRLDVPRWCHSGVILCSSLEVRPTDHI